MSGYGYYPELAGIEMPEPSLDYKRNQEAIRQAFNAGGRDKTVNHEIKTYPGIEYAPEAWNDNLIIRDRTNCYAYALNLWYNPINNEPLMDSRITPNFGIKLGGISNNDVGHFYGEYNKNSVVDLCKKDCDALGFDFIKATPGMKPPIDGWTIAIAIDPSRDYHFYRKNLDGTWSHKPGAGPVTKLDSLGMTIHDPENCNRMGLLTSYSDFAGFFFISPKRNHHTGLEDRHR